MSPPDRPSRQALVVPPRSSNLPLVTGIIAAGAVGCGLAWGLTGRESRREPTAADAPPTAALLPEDLAPLPATIESRPVRPTSFQDEDTAALEPAALDRPVLEPPADRTLSRFSKPVVPPLPADMELAAVEPEVPAAGAADPPGLTIEELPEADAVDGRAEEVSMADRPRAAGVPPPDSRYPPAKEGVRFLAPVDDDDEAGQPMPDAVRFPDRIARVGDRPRGLDAVALQNVELEEDLPGVPDVAAAAVSAAAAGVSANGRAPHGGTTDDEADVGGQDFAAAADDDPAPPGRTAPPASDIVPSTDVAPSSDVAPAPGLEPAFTADAAIDEAVEGPPRPSAPLAPPVSPFAQAPPLVEPSTLPDPRAAFGPPRGLSADTAALPVPPSGPTGGLLPRFPAGDLPARTPPPPQPVAVPVSNPFIAAPPLGGPPPPSNGYDEERPPQAARPDDSALASGQGRPGPVQLEGVQAPQLTVEKRGPREVQVGKPARYEVFVRNVGSAVAHDVMLRDAVPVGTMLVTTTPPAMPGRAATGVPTDELVWPLGTLPPGGQSRVVIELMPQTEGEIGSVASVTFRADASVRSRATRPALAIECPTPEAVRIGGDALLRITVENPGTGVATGVVLEGFLPDNVSHRSGRELEFDVGQLKPGETRSIELVLGTRGPGIHPARFVARADSGLEVERLVRLEVTAPTLEVAVDMPVRRFLQRAATCEISLVNAGTATARSVELAAQLPPGLKFVRANNAGWHDDRTNRVLWNLEELPAGETGTVEVVVMPVELGPQKIVAAARSVDGPADQVAHVCEVEGLAALFFEVTDSEDPIEVNGVTEYVIRVGNQGTQAATGVRLVATLLGDLQPIAAQGPAGHRVENLTVAFEPLAKLAPSEEVVFRVRARGLSPGDQRVQVQLTSADHPAPITKEEVTRVYSDR